MQKIKEQIIYPKFNDIDLSSYELINGYATLGFLKKHRPDCLFITEDQWQDYNNYEWLDNLIDSGLRQGKIVCVVPWDEEIINPDHLLLSKVLNKYKDDPVWMITQLNEEDQKIYKFQHQIECKIIELPWWMLNDCLGYYKLANRSIENSTGPKNFLCMIGRYDKHKADLVKEIHHNQLNNYGIITITNKDSYPKDLRYFCEVNPTAPYINLPNPWPKMAAQSKIKDTWVSSNVENFLHIEQKYSNIPLILHPETSCGIFFNTEKSLWPLLLGKLMLVYGKPGVMQHVQRFYDISFSEYADLTFDLHNNDWSEAGNKQRLKMLIEKNYNLIQDCSQVYKKLQSQLEAARWTIGQNIYKYFVQQLEKISH